MTTAKDVQTYDVVVVGAGFSGLYLLHKLRGMGFSVRVIEGGDGVGGTWFWNRYPGARCDVESIEYSYSFSEELQQEWEWSEQYSAQPEILEYLNHVADRFDLRKDIAFETWVEAADYDEASQTWTLSTDTGQRFEARFCIMATGCLSAWQIPDFPGLEVFEGDYYHTANWPKDGVDFTGRRAAVIGTGSTGIQSIPIIAEQAEHLYVFQRTPNYSIPANNDPLTEEEAQKFKEMYPEIREKARHSGFGIGVLDIAEESALGLSEEEQQELMWKGWKAGGFRFLLAHPNVLVDEEENEMVAQFVRDRIEDIVDDPEVAELLKPTDYPIGTKRICVDSGYYKTFNRDNVELVDVNEAPIERITEKGLVTGGREYAFDTLVFATGFDAMTGALENIDISGKGGVKLTDKWSEGPRSYLGLMVAGFPNLFTVTGPGSPSVLSNMITSIEQHVEWLTDCIDWMREKGKTEIEATKSAEDDWVVHVNEVAHYTLYPQAESWYMGANIPGKPRVFSPYIGGVGAYREKCAEVAEQGYAGFKLRSADTKQSATPSVDAEAMATK